MIDCILSFLTGTDFLLRIVFVPAVVLGAPKLNPALGAAAAAAGAPNAGAAAVVGLGAPNENPPAPAAPGAPPAGDPKLKDMFPISS